MIFPLWVVHQKKLKCLGIGWEFDAIPTQTKKYFIFFFLTFQITMQLDVSYTFGVKKLQFSLAAVAAKKGILLFIPKAAWSTISSIISEVMSSASRSTTVTVRWRGSSNCASMISSRMSEQISSASSSSRSDSLRKDVKSILAKFTAKGRGGH